MSSPSPNIIWIVSYPKSGNTWVRFLVCNLVFGPQTSAAALNSLAPDIHELGQSVELPAAPIFLKTHFPFSAELPLVSQTAAAIYVVRDPADVMLSNFHYSRRSSNAAAQTTLPQYVEQYLAQGGDPRWIQLGMGTWDAHVRSWLAVKHPFPLLFLRYEDLLADTMQGANQICGFLGLNRSHAEMKQAVAGASFSRMRQIEDADIRARKVGIFYKPYLQQPIETGLRFMRAGLSGEAARVLTSEQQSALAAVFGPVMRELGYNESSGAAARA
jgi:hypothetical protein